MQNWLETVAASLERIAKDFKEKKWHSYEETVVRRKAWQQAAQDVYALEKRIRRSLRHYKDDEVMTYLSSYAHRKIKTLREQIESRNGPGLCGDVLVGVIAKRISVSAEKLWLDAKGDRTRLAKIIWLSFKQGERVI